MKKMLFLVLVLLLVPVVAFSQVSNPLGPTMQEANCVDHPHNTGCCASWTMKLSGVEYVVDGDTNAFTQIPKQYTFNVKVCDGSGWKYFDSDIILHSWAFFGDKAETPAWDGWYGFVNGGFHQKTMHGFISGEVQSLAGGYSLHELFKFRFNAKFTKFDKKHGRVTEIRGTALSYHSDYLMQGEWPEYWTGDYDFVMKYVQDDPKVY
jgi:hypothetical protein